nr:hypothetical protein [Methylorubrum zatmanii]
MLVEDSAQLIGFFSASSEEPGFLIPVFHKKFSNMLFVQEINPLDKVAGFREISGSRCEFVSHHAKLSATVGDDALWGFRNLDGSNTFLPRNTMQRALRPIVNDINAPFLRLQVAQFCDQSDGLINAWKTAYKHLANSSPQSAEAWRDVVVIPNFMRTAVGSAVLRHGLNYPFAQVGRATEIVVRNKKLIVRLDDELFEQIDQHQGAKAILEQSAKLLSKTFDITSGSINIERAIDGSTSSSVSPDTTAQLTAIAVGNSAIRCFETASWNLEAYLSHLSVSETVLDGIPIHIYTNRVSQTRERVDTGYDIDTLLKNISGPSYVLFNTNDHSPEVIDLALDISERLQGNGQRIVGVLLGIPETLLHDSNDVHDLRRAITSHFDQFYILSDYSSNLNQAQAYGPARSVESASNNLAKLLEVFFGIKKQVSSKKSIHRGVSISYLCSVIGERSAENLIDHMVARIPHPSFHLEQVFRASIWLRSSKKSTVNNEYIENQLSRLMPLASLQMESLTTTLPQRSEATLLFDGIELDPDRSDNLQHFGMSRLQACGWVIREEDFQHKSIKATHSTSQMGPVRFEFKRQVGVKKKISFKFTSSPDYVSITITRDPVRRDQFVLGVLLDNLPLHFTKINGIQRIYGQRYAHVIAMADNMRLIHRDAITYSALKFVYDSREDLFGMIDRFAVERLCGRRDYKHISFTSKNVFVDLPLRIADVKSQATDTVVGVVRVALDRSGWHWV